ncbi:MAG: hypothetical protein QOJ56_4921 [Mycobacterium sp.]|jgi:hypothetical protein|nr:hypothetical protein [Mycobacterium sp.]
MTALATKVRSATAACAIAAAATLTPAAIAHATPGAPLPEAGVGSSLGTASVTTCDPAVPGSCALAPITTAPLFGGGGAAIAAPPFFWLGSPGNPNYQPIFGITFPNFFGLDFEACIFGLGVRLGPYGTGFIGLSAGC